MAAPGRGTGGRLLREAARLSREGKAFALATVVRAERPTSARPGAKAIITPDRRVRGFVGGACVRPLVLREALAALEDGSPRLLRISPDAPPPGAAAEEGVLEETMACVSGGALDIHIEPHLPAPRLAVFGDSPVAEACRSLGEALGFAVPDSPDDASGVEAACEGAVVVVAAHGDGEWDVLRAALDGGRARWVGLVASPKRAAAVRRSLVGMGVSADAVENLRSPAGLDIGAETPPEIALSILAQVVSERRAQATRSADLPERRSPDRHGRSDHLQIGTAPSNPLLEPPPPVTQSPPPVGIALTPEPTEAFIDPICGMTVRADSPHRLEDSSGVVLFCCSGCLTRYQAANP